MSKAVMLSEAIKWGGYNHAEIVLESQLLYSSVGTINYIENQLHIDTNAFREIHVEAINNTYPSHRGDYINCFRGLTIFLSIDTGTAGRDGASISYSDSYDWYCSAGTTLKVYWRELII